MVDNVWRLYRGDEILGEITVAEADFPWLTGSFTPAAGFAGVASLFAEELALSELILDNDDPAGVDAWEAAYQRITTTMTLVGPSGPAAEFLLHIDAGEAWFRWSAEPFDTD